MRILLMPPAQAPGPENSASNVPCHHSTMLRNSLRDLAPPIARQLYRDLRSGRREYRSFTEAQNAAAPGYSSTDLTWTVAKKTEAFRSSTAVTDPVITSSEFALFATLFALRDLTSLSVLDFGGAAGASYYRARPWVRARSVDWRVIETAAMVEAARTSAPAELSFHPDLFSATTDWTSPPDVVLVSSTLQYLEDPETTLSDLVGTEPRVLVLARTPLASSSRSHTLVQKSRLSENGPGSLPPGVRDSTFAYPVTFLPLQTVTSILSARYRHVHHIVEESNLRTLRGGVVVGQHSFIASGQGSR